MKPYGRRKIVFPSYYRPGFAGVRTFGREPDPFDCLTPREKDIVRELSFGACNKEIGQRLNMAEKTVKTHLTSIFRKLGVHGRVNVALYIKSRLLPLASGETPSGSRARSGFHVSGRTEAGVSGLASVRTRTVSQAVPFSRNKSRSTKMKADPVPIPFHRSA